MDRTQESWNIATRNHNAHKGDQAAFLRAGGDTLFEDELALLGPLEGRRLLHLQCNSGQDSLCLARRGADVTGVDFSDEAIAFARRLSDESGIPATFALAEVIDWLERTDARFDVAFASYGVLGWLSDLDRWARALHRALVPGGRFVYVEFHPLVWSIGEGGQLTGDDYFAESPFIAPVNDYVAASGEGLGAPAAATPGANDVPAASYQHTLAKILSTLVGAGFALERLEEYPYANGCKVCPSLVPGEGRRWVLPQGIARVPLMFGLAVRRA